MRRSTEPVKALDGLSNTQVKHMVNWQDDLGLSPLHIAIRNKNLAHVQKLISLGADCSLPDADGNTPLHFAAESGSLEILNSVADGTDDLDLQNNLGETPVLLAAHAGYIGAVVSLTSMDKHVVPADTGILDVRGRNILMHACVSGDIDLVRLILANREGNSQRLSMARTPVNAEDADGVTALMYAATESHWHLVSVLVANKANVAVKDKRGKTALHWAAAHADASTVSALIDCGVVINDPDASGWTPLMHAVSENNVEVAELLIECNATPDQTLSLVKSQEMHVVICDAVRDSLVRHRRSQQLTVNGRLVVTVVRAENFYIDPSSVSDGTDELVVYAVVQLKASGASTESELVGFTAGVPVNAESRSIAWNEPVTFFLKNKIFDESAVLCIDFFATRNHAPVSDLLDMAHAAGEDAGDDEDAETRESKMDRMYKQIQEFEQKVLLLEQKLKDRQDQLQAFRFSDHKRRWNQLLESRKRLVKFFDISLPVPPVPATHFPCGSLRMRFSRLRPIIRPPGKLVEFSRRPRFTDKGDVRFDIDYVPLLCETVAGRNEIFVPKVPTEADLPLIDAPEHLFHPATEPAGYFATRADKLATQSREHYSRWWSSLGEQNSNDTRKNQRNAKTAKTFKESENELVKTVNIIAKSLIK